jgi:hypothetical protein
VLQIGKNLNWESSKNFRLKNSTLSTQGLAEKDDFCAITAKNADQKRFFSNFVGLAPYP